MRIKKIVWELLVLGALAMVSLVMMLQTSISSSFDRLPPQPTRQVFAYVSSSANGFETVQDDGERAACFSFSKFVNNTARFYPKEFLEEGPGRPFLPLFNMNRNHQTPAGEQIFKLEMVGFRNVLDTPDCEAIQIHIYKNGGTTVRKSPGAIDLGPESVRGGVSWKRIGARQTMQRVSQSQIDDGNNPVTVFSFLRDPVPRFVSAVSQVLRINRRKEVTVPCRRMGRRRNNTAVLLSCVLTMIEESKTYRDHHLLPQAFLLYDAMQNQSVAVELMDLNDAQIALRSLGMSEVDTSEEEEEENEDDEYDETSSMEWRNALPSKVGRFNFTNALTPSLIARICRIYQVDLELLRSTGLTHSLCDEPWFDYDR